MKLIALGSIRVYQFFLSFDHGLPGKILPGVRICIHTPSCSEYTYQSIQKYGIIRGTWFGFLRILRCNPYSKGGYDPVP